MKAISAVNGTLQDVELPRPEPRPHDLIVKVEAISVNPVDTKVRKGTDASGRVLGWDVAGTVEAVGSAVSLFKPGDAVWYAGSLVRPGANSEYHAVDERIVGRKPASLGVEQAAALPLTAITAWEALFERLGIDRNGAHANKRILIIGGAGGVGSIAIQMASKLARLEVIATASRQESADWCRDLGATHIIDHTGDLHAQLKALDIPAVDYILCLNSTDQHFAAMVEAVAPQGKICSIVEAKQPLAVDTLFRKSATLVFELMFTRSMFGTADMVEQHKLLTEVARLIDEGVLRTTVNEVSGGINAANL
ncbi:MAG: zinc-binding alcohol dehydrogenase family protein, partial [Gammaproteobacteria bacterium]